MKILMAAAENDALPKGKVGGIGDVVRDIPIALAQIGHQVDVVIPSYGYFSMLPGAEHKTLLYVMFAGQLQAIDIYEIPSKNPTDGVTQWVIEHPIFAIGGEGKIYCDDAGNRPFASDATKFALFSACVAKAIVSKIFGDIDVLHLHDWHTAMISVLRKFDPEYQELKNIQTVYTIHNLALQGIRPLDGDESSFKAWFPYLSYDVRDINDPRYPHCYNPMRAGINLSDKVHAVSPNYVKEILLPSNIEQGFFGGEGLESDLRTASDLGKLHGILNGCDYPEQHTTPLKLKALLKASEDAVMQWLGDKALIDYTHLVAMTRLKQMSEKKQAKNTLILTSVGRITDQKIRLFQQVMPNGETALEQLLTLLGDNGIFILLGSGDKELEGFLTKIAVKEPNFIFLKGYSEALSETMYSSGDLFLMPSSFEPCGISQMLSMRAGQPCLAHSVGGLSDTIIHEENGFTFNGSTPLDQAKNMLSTFSSVMELKKDKPKEWEHISQNALTTRFLWKNVAEDYIKYLYTD